MFGDFIVTSVEDDLGEAFMMSRLDPEDCYAMITDDFAVEILGNVNGEKVCGTTDGLFTDLNAAEKWAKSWVNNIDVNV